VAMKRFNLLPPEQRVKTSRDRGRLYAVVGLVVLLVALGAVYFQQNAALDGKEAELADLNAQVAVVQQQLVALAPYAEINKLRTAMTETATQLYVARIPWSTVIEEVSLVIPENVRLQQMSCAVPASMLPGPQQAKQASATASTDITFTGVTYSHKDVAEFMTRLGLIPQLANIQLASSTSATTASGSSTTTTVTFTVTASLREYVTTPPSTTLQTTGAAQ
jgi:Tfp pilus assembly protein PilN